MSQDKKRPNSPSSSPSRVETKLTKWDEELLALMEAEKTRTQKEAQNRMDALRIPLSIPNQDEMHEILISIRSAIVVDPQRMFSFVVHNSQDGMIFDTSSYNWGFMWLKRPNQWLLNYREKFNNNLLDDISSRDFASSYVEEQLHAYFQSIADAWNAKCTVIQLVPELSSNYCGFETKKNNN